ncbi:phosphotransferase [Streptomyces sp. 3MP-14]|uniref:Phosphotransferase n=1 Tax=Streptomyces mimosae TaxID=2586635 RepID=A0A5N6AQI7_9ACTN|nr:MULTISPECIES: phosphotransferase [Streptomyces]KAB8169898.1 phosphotransferase [Streptomyces mimosae]KAB8178646.1 phosphotransferase [Streptomyces sp. 3MP-14]
MPTASPEPETGTPLVEILADAYGLAVVRLARLDGQATVNYRATTADDRVVFVKHYQPGADLAAEEEAVAQTDRAGRHGVPVAAVLPSTSGEAITRRAGTALSVWRWMPGHTVENGFTLAQQAAAGTMLGRIHVAFADHPASSRPSARADHFRTPDLAEREATIDHLLSVIGDLAEPDAFDREAAHTLRERRDQLRRLRDLGLPTLHTQVLHGDYSPKNILFDGDTINAVVDFGPAAPFLTAWELGRIAFDPRRVVRDGDWIVAGTTLVAAYRDANPRLPATDLAACARVALTQLLVSLYGVEEHYLRPGLLQDDLDAFWLLRHRAASTILDHLDEAEDALAQIAGTRLYHPWTENGSPVR